MPDNLKRLQLRLHLAWSRGALRDLVWVAVTLVTVIGGGVFLGWDRIAQLLSFAPLALAAFLTFNTLFLPDPAVAAIGDDRVVIVFPMVAPERIFRHGNG